MNFLLDTCFLSELVKPAPDQGVVGWLWTVAPHQLFVSAMTLGELHRGVMKLPASRRRDELGGWLEQVERDFEDRVLPFSRETAHRWAELCAGADAQGRRLAAFDSIIAATARQHDLALVTRNERDFEPAGVQWVNPWVGSGETCA